MKSKIAIKQQTCSSLTAMDADHDNRSINYSDLQATILALGPLEDAAFETSRARATLNSQTDAAAKNTASLRGELESLRFEGYAVQREIQKSQTISS